MRQLFRIIVLISVVLCMTLEARTAGKEVTYTGTGFVVHPDGYLLTCAHMIEYGNAHSVMVTLGGNTYPASVLSFDSVRDIALLQIPATNLTALPLMNSNAVRLGEEVRAVGYPLSSLIGNDIKITRGSIAGITSVDTRKTFQIDAPVNQGNSGGPIVNERGEVLGIVNAKLTIPGVEGVGFAVPINYARAMLRDEFIDPLAMENGNKLDGPTLAQRVTPAVAFLTVIATEQEDNKNENAAAGDKTTEVLRVKRIEMVDDNGNVRGQFFTENGNIFLGLFDANGKARVGFRVVDGEPGVALCNEAGNMRALLGLTQDSPFLTLADNKQNQRLLLSLTNGEPALQLIDNAGLARGVFGIIDDVAGLAVFAPNMKSRGLLSTMNGNPGLDLFDSKGMMRSTFNLVEDAGGLVIYDAAGLPRGYFTMLNGAPVIRLLNAAGKNTWKAP